MASKAAERLRAKAATVTAKSDPGKTDPPAETEPRKTVSTEVRDSGTAGAKTASTTARPKTGGRTKPVKMTVDLAPIEHRKLRLWCAQTAADLELPEVAASEVVRVLVARLQTDPGLAEAVRTDLAANGGSRRGWA